MFEFGGKNSINMYDIRGNISEIMYRFRGKSIISCSLLGANKFSVPGLWYHIFISNRPINPDNNTFVRWLKYWLIKIVLIC